MNCARCEELLLERTEGTPDGALPPAIENHLSSCQRCHDLAELLESAMTAPALDDVFTAAVLARTAGRDPVAEVIAQLERDLPHLATLEPDAAFTADVLAVTSSAPPAEAAFVVEARDIWQRFVQRPRLALESAYLAAVLALLLFGLPFSPLAELPRSVGRGLDSPPAVRFVTTSAAGVAELGRTTWTRAGDLFTYRPSRTLAETIPTLERSTWRLWLEEIAGRLSTFWNRSVGPALQWLTTPFSPPTDSPSVPENDHDRIPDSV